MTIVFSAAAPYLIVMTADSAVTLDFGDSREYSIGRKTYSFPGIGCISTWGARDGNRIGEFLNTVGISANKHSVNDLADYVYQYLTQEYKPDQIGLDDLGYHVAGFDRDGSPKLFHVFWGFDQPRPPTQTKQEYKIYDHSPKNGAIFFLYNGRNDIAHFMVYLLLDQINRGKSTRFNFGHPADLSKFGDFIARFASELTPEVGPPFITCLISPNNQINHINNKNFSPIGADIIMENLKGLGYKI